MIVVDTSALIGRLVGRPRNEALVERLRGETQWHAPHLVDVECVHVLRRLVRAGEVAEEQAVRALARIAAMPILRYSHELLVDRMWELRNNLSAYDAAFVALAEALEQPLITTDLRLKGAPTHRAEIEIYPPT